MGESLSVTLRMQCAGGLTSPSTHPCTAGTGFREGTLCPTAGRPLTTPPGQLQVQLNKQSPIPLFCCLFVI